MYALVSWWQLPEGGHDEPMLEREPTIIPLVRDFPGFVESYWTYERSNAKSVGFTLIDTAEHAHDLKNAIETLMETQDQTTIRLEMIRVQEILSHVIVRPTKVDAGRTSSLIGTDGVGVAE
jgi:hypothetical protein